MELFSMPFFLGDPHNFEYVRFWISVELEPRNTGSGAYEPAQLIDWRELRVGGVKALPRNGVKVCDRLDMVSRIFSWAY